MKVRDKKEIVNFFRYLSRLGVIRGTYIYFLLKFLKKESIRIPGLPYPIFLRRGTSDTAVFDQIFIARHYNFTTPQNMKVIIDCGANIGLASIFFAVKFPQAHIVAIEPEASNFEALKRNCNPYKNISVLKKAIWYKKDILALEDPGLGHYGFMTVVSGEIPKQGIEAVGIQDILQQYNFDQIDLLKIDIEGAEKELFTYDYDLWLPRTRLITIEVHDRLRKGASTALIKALSKYDFSISSYGESFVCEKNSY